MLNRSNKNEHPWSIPDLRGKAFSFTIKHGVLLWSFHRSFLSGWGGSCLFLVECLSYKTVGFCEMLLMSTEMIILLCHLLIWCITLVDYHMLISSCIPGEKSIHWWFILLFTCYWILLARIVLRIFASLVVIGISDLFLRY